MKIFIIINMLLVNCFVFGQNDTIQSFDVKVVFDSIQNSEIYYEKIDLNNKDIFDNSNFRIIPYKVVKFNNGLKIIKNGRIIQETNIVEEPKITVVTLYDSHNSSKVKVLCKNSELYKVEKYGKGKILISNQFGLNQQQTYFEYSDWGYFEIKHFNGKVSKFKVSVDVYSGKELKKELVSTSANPDILKDSEGNYIFSDNNDSSFIYNKYKKYCVDDNR